MSAANKTTFEASLSAAGENAIKVQGVLDFDTVPVLAKEAVKLLQNMNEAQVSFADVADSNSAGLALILEMKRTMQKNKKRISFTDLPEQILIMASAYGINEELSAVLNSPL